MKSVNKNGRLRFLMLIVLSLSLTSMLKAQPKSGLYSDCFMLCVDKKNYQVSGYLWRNVYNDGNPSSDIYQTCYLLLKGKYKDLSDTIKIDIYNNFNQTSIAKGNLFLTNNKVFFQTNVTIISCMNAFDFRNGELFEFKRSIPIIFCSRIKVDKAFFYKKNKKTNSYLVKGDFISVIGQKDAFLIVQYVDKNAKIIEGCIKKSEVEQDPAI